MSIDNIDELGITNIDNLRDYINNNGDLSVASNNEGTTILMDAIELNKKDVVNYLLELPADKIGLSKVNNAGDTAIIIAVNNENIDLDLLDKLLSNYDAQSLNLEKKDKNNYTFFNLFLAFYEKMTAINKDKTLNLYKKLLNIPANRLSLNNQTDDGETAIMQLASTDDAEELLDLLLDSYYVSELGIEIQTPDERSIYTYLNDVGYRSCG